MVLEAGTGHNRAETQNLQMDRHTFVRWRQTAEDRPFDWRAVWLWMGSNPVDSACGGGGGCSHARLSLGR